MNSSFTSKKFWLIFSLLSLWVGWIVFANKYLPMVDVPQFASQISILKEMRQPDSIYHAVYKKDWYSPYILSVGLCYGLSLMMSVPVAIKIVTLLSLIGLPLALVFFLKKTRGYVWFSLLGFPLGFGFVFLWGFLSMMLANVVSVLFFAVFYDAENAGSPPLSPLLLILATVLFFSHVFVFAFGMAVLLTQFGLRHPKKIIPCSFLLVLPALWFLMRAKEWPFSFSKIIFHWDLHRVLEFFPDLVGDTLDPVSRVAGALLLGSLFFIRPCWKPFAQRGVLLFVAVAGYMLSPREIPWLDMIYQRFPIYIVLGLLLLIEPNPKMIRRWQPFVFIGLTVVWLGVVSFRFAGFNRETRGFDVISKKMEPNKTFRSLIFFQATEFNLGIPFLHFPVWAVTDRKSISLFNFAIYPNWVVHYKNQKTAAEIDRLILLVWAPQEFRWAIDGNTDYVVIRSFLDPLNKVFGSAKNQVELVAQEGAWWLYQRKKLECRV